MPDKNGSDGSKTVRLKSTLKFTGIPNQVVEQYTSKIGLDCLGLYVLLKKFADYSSGDCYPKISTLAEISGVSERTIIRKLDVLVSTGLIHKQSGQLQGGANTYTFVLPEAGLSYRYDNHDIPGMTAVTYPNKEELEPLNENQLTLSSPAETGNGNASKPTNGKVPDLRHQKFKTLLCDFYKYLNPEMGEYQWTAADAGQLGRFLKHWPNLTRKEFRAWLVNYDNSDGIIPTKTPCQILPNIHLYADTPLDKYNRPQEEKHSVL